MPIVNTQMIIKLTKNILYLVKNYRMYKIINKKLGKYEM